MLLLSIFLPIFFLLWFNAYRNYLRQNPDKIGRNIFFRGRILPSRRELYLVAIAWGCLLSFAWLIGYSIYRMVI